MKLSNYWKFEFSEALMYPFVFMLLAYVLTKYFNSDLFRESEYNIYFGVALVGMCASLIINLLMYYARKRHG